MHTCCSIISRFYVLRIAPYNLTVIINYDLCRLIRHLIPRRDQSVLLILTSNVRTNVLTTQIDEVPYDRLNKIVGMSAVITTGVGSSISASAAD